MNTYRDAKKYIYILFLYRLLGGDNCKIFYTQMKKD